MNLIVAKVVAMKLNSKSEDILSVREHKTASAWLSNWTCANNFKKVLASDYVETLDKLRRRQSLMYTLKVILKSGSIKEVCCEDFTVDEGLIFCYNSEGKLIGVIKEWISFCVVEEEE